jgi:peroxiredoxin
MRSKLTAAFAILACAVLLLVSLPLSPSLGQSQGQEGTDSTGRDRAVAAKPTSKDQDHGHPHAHGDGHTHAGDDGGGMAMGESPVQGPIKQDPRILEPGKHKVGRLMPDLAFKDIFGREYQLSDITEKHRATVIALTNRDCPVCQKYLPRLKRLAERYRQRDVAFLFVNMNLADDTGRLRQYVKDRGIDTPYIHDTGKRFGRALGAKTTADAFVLDRARTLVYRGAIDDQYGLAYIKDQAEDHYLKRAINATLEGRQPKVEATWAPACELALEPRDAADNTDTTLTYHGRISRIIDRNCVQCHRDGGVAPFSLETYQDVIGHRGMIENMVEWGRMPPWFAAEDTGPWANDRSFSPPAKRDLLTWLDSERLKGDPANAPVPPRFPDGWSIGEPDAVFELPEPVDVPAEGLVPYKYARVKTSFDEAKWVTAMEVRPTQRQVVHHALVFANTKKEEGIGLDGFLAAYVPGNSRRIYADGLAKKLPAGATLVFQMHYTPNGEAVRDRTKLGLVFADEPPEHRVRTKGIANTKIEIPPHTANHKETAEQHVPRDAKLLSLMPHMHYRGKSFRYVLERPDGRTERLLAVPRYDFNWQLAYRFAEPVLAPRGSTIHVSAWYDNSADNPANPDPSRTVEWGVQSIDEMMIGYVEYYLP